MNWKYADFRHVGGDGHVDVDTIIPALDQEEGSAKLCPVMNIADKAILTEAFWERFDENGAVDSNHALNMWPCTSVDTLVTAPTRSEPFRHMIEIIDRYDGDKSIPLAGKWFSRPNLQALMDIIGESNEFAAELEWADFMHDGTIAGNNYKGLTHTYDLSCHDDLFKFGYPWIQYTGEQPSISTDVRSLYYCMSKMKTRILNSQVIVEDPEPEEGHVNYTFVHTNASWKQAPAYKGVIYSWAAQDNTIGTDYQEDICRPSRDVQHLVTGAWDMSKFTNFTGLFTYRASMSFVLVERSTQNVRTMSMALYLNKIFQQDGGYPITPFDLSSAQSLVLPRYVQSNYAEHTVLGNKLNDLINYSLGQTSLGRHMDFSKPINPLLLWQAGDPGVYGQFQIIKMSLAVGLDYALPVNDKLGIDINLEQYYD